jgi:hypothetical protein
VSMLKRRKHRSRPSLSITQMSSWIKDPSNQMALYICVVVVAMVVEAVAQVKGGSRED